MFCSKCGNPLETEGAALVCRAGAMELAPAVAQGLSEVFIARSRKSVSRPVSFPIGGNWFCPGCGIQMEERSGMLSCPQCYNSLNEFVVALVEAHPHRE